MSQCRLCGQDKKLVRAHVIPESFFRVLRSGGENPRLISNAANAFPQRAPIGVYDQGILCEECERKFGHVDDYGARVLLTRFYELFHSVVHLDKTVALQARDVDQELLLRFFIATLWRASVSTHPFYSRVELGKYEAQAKGVIDLSQPVRETFAVVLSYWPTIKTTRNLPHALMDPFREKWDGVNAYRFYFGQVVAYIKVDSRSFPRSLQDLALCRHNILSIVQRDFIGSKDFLAMAWTAKQSHQREQMARARRRKR